MKFIINGIGGLRRGTKNHPRILRTYLMDAFVVVANVGRITHIIQQPRQGRYPPGTHLGMRDHVPFLQTGVELCVFWNCERHCTSIVCVCGTDAPDARSRTKPCEMCGTTQGAAGEGGRGTHWRQDSRGGRFKLTHRSTWAAGGSTCRPPGRWSCTRAPRTSCPPGSGTSPPRAASSASPPATRSAGCPASRS